MLIVMMATDDTPKKTEAPICLVMVVHGLRVCIAWLVSPGPCSVPPPPGITGK